MPRLTARQWLSTASRWPLGIGLTFWRYLWRTVPMHRIDEDGDPELDKAPGLPDDVSRDEVQGVEAGHGPLFHRRYRTRIRDARMGPEELMACIEADPDVVAPTEFASFQKTAGDEGTMRIGDEFVVRMPGPWDGPVRVVAVAPQWFQLATLEGHLEAGQIRFSAWSQDGLLIFEIESWARSSSRLVDLLYDRLRISKETQLHMWTSVLQRAAELAGGRVTRGIDIHTRRVHEEALARG